MALIETEIIDSIQKKNLRLLQIETPTSGGMRLLHFYIFLAKAQYGLIIRHYTFLALT
jgi:hypothetical protein